MRVELQRCGRATPGANFRGTRKFPARPTIKIATPLVRWRLLITPPLGAAENMALDEALMARARRSGEAVLRTYGWATPTLSLGRNQRARGAYDLEAIRARGVAVVRRPTGGRALLHAREVTYSVTAPAPGEVAVTTSYARINALLVRALATLGVRASPAPQSARAATPGPMPCFAEPSAGEIEHDGRKLVGSAQWREDGALLQHGSILVDDDQALIAELMIEPPAASPAPATLRAILGRAPAGAELHAALAGAVRTQEDGGAEPLDLDAETRADAARLAERYRDAAWTWRR